jgi:hypothetical protein
MQSVWSAREENLLGAMVNAERLERPQLKIEVPTVTPSDLKQLK